MAILRRPAWCQKGRDHARPKPGPLRDHGHARVQDLAGPGRPARVPARRGEPAGLYPEELRHDADGPAPGYFHGRPLLLLLLGKCRSAAAFDTLAAAWIEADEDDGAPA